MSIMQFVQKLAPGGLEILSTSLATHLNTKNMIVSLEGEKTMLIAKWAHLSQRNYDIQALQKKAGIDFSLYQKLFALIKQSLPQAIVTHHIGPLLYAGIAARLCGIETRIHVEHDSWHLRSKKRLWVTRLAMLLAKPKLVAVSQLVANELEAHGFKNIITIKNGVDIDKFAPIAQNEARQALNLPLNVKLFGSAGRLEHVKGHDLLLEAFAKIYTQSHLVIAGDGSQMVALKAQAKALDIEKRVHFLGHICIDSQFYSALDCFIMPSRAEGLPLALLEAQACNVPAICFNVGGMSEGLDPHSGQLVEAENTQQLALAMARPLEEVSPRQFIKSKFNLVRMVKRYHLLLK